MIRLNNLKQKGSQSSKQSSQCQSSSYLRITKDINDLHLPNTCQMQFPDPDDLCNFKLTISPDDGFYRRMKVIFDFRLSDNYPYDPPKVKCETDIYHPNIDLDGNVCLNILREDWKPVLSIDAIIYGLQYLLLEPNPFDGLNEIAANQLKCDTLGFERNVRNVADGSTSVESLSMKKPCGSKK